MAGNLDMFSRLTDEILLIIIFFLPFKEAARTCVLSKRWRHIWRETKNIDFDERFFVGVGESQERQETQRQIFIDFARQWMKNYKKTGIDKFRLSCLKPVNFREDVERCIAFAISHNVKVLDLDFSDPILWEEDGFSNHEALFDLPMNVYGHVVLESLKLFSCSFRVSDFMNLKALKHVSLGWLQLKVSFIESLLLNCPLLESLSLTKCWNLEHLRINGPNLRLRSLVIDKCNFLRDHWFDIEAPNLRFLKYSGVVGIFDIEINRNYMEEADLDFGLEFEVDEAVGNLLHKLLEQLYPIRVLTVCSYMLQVIPLGEEPLRMSFPLNLKHLILKAAMHENELYGIRFFLNSCPYLETLTIEIGPGRVFDDYTPPFELNPDRFWTQCPKFDCLGRNLKVVDIKGFTGTRHEVCLLCYLIFYGRVLECLNITIWKEGGANGGNVEVYRKRAQGLQSFKKGSPNLQISIY
ncbi:hypothetical protein F2P56_005391 [Juglans regia]|nr:hypothetical protein F2P56_005391 [Juglans regia]